MSDTEETVNLKSLSRDMREVTLMLREVVKYMKDAESEIPEKMRRFIMYFHDVHDIWWLYMQTGHNPPEHIKKEIERCADRYKHILDDLYGDQGAFERVRQEMSKRTGNKYDHSRMVSYETGSRNESKRGAAPEESGLGG
jgi:hypothetical protein